MEKNQQQENNNANNYKNAYYLIKDMERESSSFLLAVLGASLLLISVFLPLVSFPELGVFRYLDWGLAGSLTIIILALLSIIFTFGRIYRALWGTSITVFLISLYNFLIFSLRMPGITLKLQREFVNDYSEEKIEELSQLLQIEYGWAVIIAGGILLLAAAVKSSN